MREMQRKIGSAKVERNAKKNRGLQKLREMGDKEERKCRQLWLLNDRKIYP